MGSLNKQVLWKAVVRMGFGMKSWLLKAPCLLHPDWRNAFSVRFNKEFGILGGWQEKREHRLPNFGLAQLVEQRNLHAKLCQSVALL